MGGFRTDKDVDFEEGEDVGAARPGRRRHATRPDAVIGLADRLADQWAAWLGLVPEESPKSW
ncbi:hypothetical protein LUW77_25090 [Streptomyces radiopugnans]|nr:hypothetical protein LUW77_25090 [Streptomyces radiopugnans]